MFTSNIYKKQPKAIQNTLISLRGLSRKLLREGRNMHKLYELIAQNDYSLQQTNDYLAQKLFFTLDNAKKNTIFYSALEINEIHNPFSDIEIFPIISKKDVIESPHDFKRKNYHGVIVSGATSGTTGSPINIPQNFESVLYESAFVYRQLLWAGFQPGDKRVWIRGDMVVPLDQKSAPFWRHSVFERMLLMSSFHLSNKTIPSYIKAMAEFKPAIIQAYPSSILLIARYLKSRNEYFPGKLKSIITSSESISYDEKLLLEDVFQCKIFDWYGLFERVAAIGTCEHGRYHQISDYSFVEYLPQGDQAYEIVGTNINNSLYPLIRYKTGDIVKKSSSPCPCGRHFPTIDSIQGRVGDYLIGEDGQTVSILNHIPKGVPGLLATQFVQESIGKVHILAVINHKVFNDACAEKLIANTKERLGRSTEVSIEHVESIPLSKNGKLRQAICSIAI